jgi:hypothetical protein
MDLKSSHSQAKGKESGYLENPYLSKSTSFTPENLQKMLTNFEIDFLANSADKNPSEPPQTSSYLSCSSSSSKMLTIFI